jgi:glutaconate CoA-transferase subunit A
MSAAERKEVILSEVEAGKLIHDGMTVAIGGFINSLHPMAIIRQIIRNQVKNLTLIGSANAGLDIDLLIGAGCVKKVVATYVGADLCIGPRLKRAR